MTVTALPDTAILDMQQCLALVSLSARALDGFGDTPKETRAAVRQMREVMSLAAVLADQVLEEIEVSRRRGVAA